MYKKNNLYALVVGLILIVASFWGGYKYAGGSDCSILKPLSAEEKSQLGKTITAMKSNGTAVSDVPQIIGGKIIETDNSSITISLPQGGSSIVFLASTTAVVKSSVGTFKDLSAGKSVTVVGTKNPEGSFSARAIQLNPDTDKIQ